MKFPNDIFEILHQHGNAEKAQQMSAYLRHQFPFLGIQAPLRRELSKSFLRDKTTVQSVDWEFVAQCFALPEREFQYLACDYLQKAKRFLQIADIAMVERYIVTKPWWDSVDVVNSVVGSFCLRYPHIKHEVISRWIVSESIWLKRVAILFQLSYKEQTDTVFLREAILYNANTNEFFVNKAIGWALRQYSRSNPLWVAQFLKENTLHSLSVREARKYLPTHL